MDTKPQILVVDDKPDKLVAFGAYSAINYFRCLYA